MKRNDSMQRREAVMRLAAHGRTNKEIAHELSMTFDSVVEHIKQAFKRYEVSNRVLLALKYHNIFTGVPAMVDTNRIKVLQADVSKRLHAYEEAQVTQINLAAEANAASASVRRMYRDLAVAQARLEVAKEDSHVS